MTTIEVHTRAINYHGMSAALVCDFANMSDGSLNYPRNIVHFIAYLRQHRHNREIRREHRMSNRQKVTFFPSSSLADFYEFTIFDSDPRFHAFFVNLIRNKLDYVKRLNFSAEAENTFMSRGCLKSLLFSLCDLWIVENSFDFSVQVNRRANSVCVYGTIVAVSNW